MDSSAYWRCLCLPFIETPSSIFSSSLLKICSKCKINSRDVNYITLTNFILDLHQLSVLTFVSYCRFLPTVWVYLFWCFLRTLLNYRTHNPFGNGCTYQKSWHNPQNKLTHHNWHLYSTRSLLKLQKVLCVFKTTPESKLGFSYVLFAPGI